MHILRQLKSNFSKLLFLQNTSFEWWVWKVENNESNVLEKNNTPEDIKSNESNELEKKINLLKNKFKFTDWIAKSLYKWLNWDPSIKDDPEAKNTIDMFKKYSTMSNDIKKELDISVNEFEEFKKMWDKFEFNTGIDIDNNWNEKENKFNSNKLKTITNREFLEIPSNERLQYITKSNVDSENISNSSVKNIEFSFDQDWDGNDNNELLKLTTLWQVLPDNVREIESNGDIYNRIWLNWEFFNNSWERLKIYTWTKIEITKLWDENQLNDIKAENIKEYNQFILENSKYSTDEFKEIITTCFDKWLDSKETEFILKWDFSKLWDIDKNKADKLISTIRFLENSKLLDDYSNAWEIVNNIEKLKVFLDKYWFWIKYDINNDWTIKFLWDWSLPEWLEKDPSLEKLIKIATSQLWVNERNWWADKYLWWLDSWDIPWCAWFVNWVLEQSWYPSIIWGRKFSSRAFLWEEWFWHVWIKLWNKILWWNQWDEVSAVSISKPIIWWVMPENVWNMEKTNRWWIFNLKEIPDWAIIVFNRDPKNKSDKKIS